MANLASWRRWHRRIGLPASIFPLFAAATGFILAATEFFGGEEALRQAHRGARTGSWWGLKRVFR